jgi:hypothetical protein
VVGARQVKWFINTIDSVIRGDEEEADLSSSSATSANSTPSTGMPSNEHAHSLQVSPSFGQSFSWGQTHSPSPFFVSSSSSSSSSGEWGLADHSTEATDDRGDELDALLSALDG